MVLAHRRVPLRPDNSCCSRLCPERSGLYLWMRAASPRARLGVPGFWSRWPGGPLRGPPFAPMPPLCEALPQSTPGRTPAARRPRSLAAPRTSRPLLFLTSFRLNADARVGVHRLTTNEGLLIVPEFDRDLGDLVVLLGQVPADRPRHRLALEDRTVGSDALCRKWDPVVAREPGYQERAPCPISVGLT